MPTEPAAPKPPVSKGKVFLRRLTSTIVLWSIVLAALFSGHRLISNYVFLLIMLVLSVSGLVEFYGLVRKRGIFCHWKLGIAGGILLTLSTFWYLTEYPRGHIASRINDFESGFLILFVLGLVTRQLMIKEPNGLAAISTTLLGLMYVPWLLNFIQKINFFPDVEGKFYLLYFIVVTKFSDVGAYVTGSLIGKHKMIPRISPGKTWEGFGGAIVISTGASCVFYWLGRRHLPEMSFLHAAILGAVLSGTAVLGDLIESQMKREADVKDSGGFFPGIGGILDLLDSLLFNAPLMYLYLRHILT